MTSPRHIDRCSLVLRLIDDCLVDYQRHSLAAVVRVDRRPNTPEEGLPCSPR
jgi:hypothetical protein